jgi:Zn-dependent membrane protease YugP
MRVTASFTMVAREIGHMVRDARKGALLTMRV